MVPSGIQLPHVSIATLSCVESLPMTVNLEPAASASSGRKNGLASGGTK
jgi:hypothetical protein